MAVLHNKPWPVGQRVNCAHCGADWTLEPEDSLNFSKPDLVQTPCPVCSVPRFVGRNGAKEPAATRKSGGALGGAPSMAYEQPITTVSGAKGVRTL